MNIPQLLTFANYSDDTRTRITFIWSTSPFNALSILQQTFRIEEESASTNSSNRSDYEEPSPPPPPPPSPFFDIHRWTTNSPEATIIPKRIVRILPRRIASRRAGAIQAKNTKDSRDHGRNVDSQYRKYIAVPVTTSHVQSNESYGIKINLPIEDERSNIVLSVERGWPCRRARKPSGGEEDVKGESKREDGG